MPVFLDSNIVLYALGNDARKRGIARGLLAEQPTISTQVINECSHVLRRKLKFTPSVAGQQLTALINTVRLADVGIHDTFQAWELATRYGYSHFDCLILATALRVGCSTVYSEDMQYGQVIESCLKIINPFTQY